MAQSVPGWLETASQERQEIYSQAVSFLESQEYHKAKEHIDRLVDLLGGQSECISKGFDELFYLRGQIKSGLNELCHEDFLTAYQISNPKKIEYVKRASLECRKLHDSPWNFSLESATEWVAADPIDIEAKIVLLEGCESRRNYEATNSTRRNILEEALKNFPDHPEINYHQALYVLSQGLPEDEAAPYLIKAVDAQPENQSWRQLLLNVLQKAKKENREKSIKYLLLEVQDNPKDTTKLEEVAKYYEHFQQWNEAIETRKKLIELEPSSAERRQKLEILPLEKIVKSANAGTDSFVARKKILQQMIHIGSHVSGPAVELATELVKERPEENRLKVLRADALWLDYVNLDSSVVQETFEQLNNIYVNDAPYWRTHFTLAFYYQQQYNTAQSLDHIRKANLLKPNNYGILKRKIQLERGYGDDQHALKDYDDFFKITPEFSDLPNYLRFVQERKMWKRVIEAGELAAKAGLSEDFSSELEHSKNHLKLDEDIEKNPSAATYVARGEAWLAENKTSSAKEDFEKALEISPSDSKVRVKLAQVYILEYRYTDALAELNQAIQADPTNAEAYLERSQCGSANPHVFEDAEKACELQPNNQQNWKQLKLLYREAERFEDAIRVTKKLMEMVPADEIRYLKIEQAEYLQDLFQWSEATALFKELDMQDNATKTQAIAEIVKATPEPTADNSAVIAQQYRKIVDMMSSMYNTKAAYRMLQQVIKSEGGSKCAGLFGLLAQMYQKDYEYTNAREYYQQALQLEPDDPIWSLGLLNTKETWEFTAEEKETYVQTVLKTIDMGIQIDSNTLYNVINYATQSAKHDAVLKAYDELVKIDNSENNWTLKGVYCEDITKNNEEALKSYIKACEVAPNSANAWNNRALILNKLSDYTEAFRCAQKAIELNPYYANPYAAVAMVYLSQGKLLEAKEYAEKSVRLDPSVSRGYFVLGQIMEQKQQFHDAKDNYEKFLDFGHPDPDLVNMGQEGLQRCQNRIEVEQQSGKSKYEHHHYHLFLSHYQKTGGLLAMVLKLLLEQSDPTLKIFLDVDDLENIHDLKTNVRNSDTVALLITEGVFERRFVIEEITTALELGKNIILIWDKERCAWPDPKSVPDHLQKVLLVRAIIWNAEKDFRSVVVHQIQSKIIKTDQPQKPAPVAHQAHPAPQAAVSTEQFDQIKASIQQQYESFAKLLQQQNEMLQQTLAHQNQMFLKLQIDFNDLQQQVTDNFKALQSSHQSAAVTPIPISSTPEATPAPAPVPAEAPKSEPAPTTQPAPSTSVEPVPATSSASETQPAPRNSVEPTQATTATEPASRNSVEPSSANSSRSSYSQESKPEQAQQQPLVRNSSGPIEDASAKPRSETTSPSSPLVKPRTATQTSPSTQVKQIYTMEGWLHKLGGWNKTKWESRYFTCDGQVMIYHSSQQIIQVSSPKGSIDLKDIISVEEVAFDVYKVNCCFAVQVPSKKYFFYADDEISKMKWIGALRKKPT